MIARSIMARSFTASFSNRVATRLHSLSQFTQRSTTFLRRYFARSRPMCPPTRPIWLLRWGITGSILRRCSQRRIRRKL